MEAIPQDPIPKVKKPNGNIGRKPSEKQMEALRGGMAKLKAQREEVKKKKEEKKAKIERGEPDSSEDEAPAPAPVVPAKPKKLISQDTLLEVIPLKPARVRKPRVAKEPVAPEKKYATREDFEAFKTQMFETIKTTPMIKEVDKVIEKEVVREVPVEKIVEKRITGSAMLDSIFNFK